MNPRPPNRKDTMSESSEQARAEWEPLSVREARRKIAEWEARDNLDLIMWSLRLPLLREAIGRVEARPGVLTGNTTELARLDALIAEGERALGILPEEEAS